MYIGVNYRAGFSGILDTFTRSDNNSTLGVAETGELWKGSSGIMGISNNKAYPVFGELVFREVDLGSADFTAEVFATWVTTSSIGIVFRGDTTNNNRMTFLITNANTVTLNKKISGVSTNLGSKAFSPVNGQTYKMGIFVSGNNFKAYIDDQLIFDQTDDNVLKTNTNHGIIVAGASIADARFDDFKLQ